MLASNAKQAFTSRIEEERKPLEAMQALPPTPHGTVCRHLETHPLPLSRKVAIIPWQSCDGKSGPGVDPFDPVKFSNEDRTIGSEKTRELQDGLQKHPGFAQELPEAFVVPGYVRPTSLSIPL